MARARAFTKTEEDGAATHAHAQPGINADLPRQPNPGGEGAETSLNTNGYIKFQGADIGRSQQGRRQ
jgi:hypothetical protein